MCHSYVIENVSKKSVKISPSKKKLTDMFIRNNANLFWKKNFIKKKSKNENVFLEHWLFMKDLRIMKVLFSGRIPPSPYAQWSSNT